MKELSDFMGNHQVAKVKWQEYRYDYGQQGRSGLKTDYFFKDRFWVTASRSEVFWKE